MQHEDEDYVACEQPPFPAIGNEGICFVLMETSVAFVKLKRASLSTDIQFPDLEFSFPAILDCRGRRLAGIKTAHMVHRIGVLAL